MTIEQLLSWLKSWDSVDVDLIRIPDSHTITVRLRGNSDGLNL